MEFGDLRDNWVIQGDNLVALQALHERSLGRFRMAYLDPPYNTGTRKADAYDDRMASQAWRLFMAERLDALWPLMAADGVVMIQIDDHELGNLLALLAEQGRSVLSHVVVWSVLVLKLCDDYVSWLLNQTLWFGAKTKN